MKKEKEKKNIIISTLLILPLSVYIELSDGIAPPVTFMFVIKEWLAAIVLCLTISLIIYGLRYLIIRKGSFLTTYYKTAYFFCAFIVLSYPIAFLFGFLFS